MKKSARYMIETRMIVTEMFVFVKRVRMMVEGDGRDSVDVGGSKKRRQMMKEAEIREESGAN